MDRLDDTFDALFAGRGEFILLTGEAGVGKIRFAVEAARRAALALSGAAYEHRQQLPNGPFVEALDGFAGRMPAPELHVLPEGIATEITLLAPAIRRLLDSISAADPAGSIVRQRLFTAVTALLRRLEARPRSWSSSTVCTLATKRAFSSSTTLLAPPAKAPC